MFLENAQNPILLDKKWSSLARRLGMTNFCLAEDGFETLFVDGCEKQMLKKRQSAIYFWYAENGEAYVGQAVDVQSRLRQHYKNHRDLVSAAFVEVEPSQLDAEERRLVSLAEREFPLRNIKLVKQSASHLPLDDFLTLAEQEAFVRLGNPSSSVREPRREFSLLAARSRAKKVKFLAEGELGKVLIGAVTQFVMAALPRPIATENRFWSATYLGSGAARVNVGQQELFTCDVTQNGAVTRVLAPKRLRWFAKRSPYETQDFENVLTLDAFQRLAASTSKFRPVRERAVWLARHTTPLNLGSHCPWLFDPTMPSD